ncbi:4Fe-4S dicluster domain-containing protein [Thermodesulfobacteriota bacterium]
MNDNEKKLLKETEDCVKCGACLSVCPTYKELCEEPASPRARASLAEEVKLGNIELTDKLVEIFTKCLTCGACEAVCPKGIHLMDIIFNMREFLYKERRYGAAIHSIIKLMQTSPHAFSLIMKNAARLTPLLFKEIGDKELLTPRLALPFSASKCMWSIAI